MYCIYSYVDRYIYIYIYSICIYMIGGWPAPPMVWSPPCGTVVVPPLWNCAPVVLFRISERKTKPKRPKVKRSKTKPKGRWKEHETRRFKLIL